MYSYYMPAGSLSFETELTVGYTRIFDDFRRISPVHAQTTMQYFMRTSFRETRPHFLDEVIAGLECRSMSSERSRARVPQSQFLSSRKLVASSICWISARRRALHSLTWPSLIRRRSQISSASSVWPYQKQIGGCIQELGY